MGGLGWWAEVDGGVCFGACAGLEAVPPRCQLSDELTVRARACTNKAWQTVGGSAGVQVVVHTQETDAGVSLRWSVAAVSAAVEEEVVLKGSRTDGGSSVLCGRSSRRRAAKYTDAETECASQ